ncbi:MAG: MaoC/PaaZ C-terminal domain-containing protein [Frankia sp.]
MTTVASTGNPTRWDELIVGTAAAPFVDRPLTITDFVRYQGASGDMNPIHHDDGFARAAGFPGPFAVGMLQMGVLGTYVTDWLGAENVRKLAVQFREQAWPGDVLTYTGTVAARREENAERLVDLDLVVTRQTGGVHLKGTATFVVPT